MGGLTKKQWDKQELSCAKLSYAKASYLPGRLIATLLTVTYCLSLESSGTGWGGRGGSDGVGSAR